MTRTFSLGGLYPRRESLVKASWDHDKGLVDDAGLYREFMDATRELVALQDRLGATPLTDGNLTWQDALRGLSAAAQGVHADQVTRLFETNRFYRQPVVTGPVALDKAAFARHFLFERIEVAAPRKAILPGPYWLARAARNETGRDDDDVARDLAGLVNEGARWLAARGYTEVQFNEPLLFYRGDPEVDLAADLVARAVEGVEATTTVNFAYADLAGHLDWAAQLPVDGIGVDLVETHVDELTTPARRLRVLAAVVDSQESLLEDPRDVVRLADDVEARLKPTHLALTHTGELETVPAPVAARKLEVLAQAATREVVA